MSLTGKNRGAREERFGQSAEGHWDSRHGGRRQGCLCGYMMTGNRRGPWDSRNDRARGGRLLGFNSLRYLLQPSLSL